MYVRKTLFYTNHSLMVANVMKTFKPNKLKDMEVKEQYYITILKTSAGLENSG